MLVEVKRAYDEDKAGIYDQAAQIHRQRQDYVGRVAAGGELDHRLVDVVARRMAAAYDARNGGFGEEPKFPSAPILMLFLHLYRTTGEPFYEAILRKSLDVMAVSEFWDAPEGGFFRYCAQGDWTEAQHEKMLEDNVSLAGLYLDAGILLDEPRYMTAANHTIDFCWPRCWTGRQADSGAAREPTPPISGCRGRSVGSSAHRSRTLSAIRAGPARVFHCCWRQPGSCHGRRWRKLRWGCWMALPHERAEAACPTLLAAVGRLRLSFPVTANCCATGRLT